MCVGVDWYTHAMVHVSGGQRTTGVFVFTFEAEVPVHCDVCQASWSQASRESSVPTSFILCDGETSISTSSGPRISLAGSTVVKWK